MDAPERIWAFNAKQTGYRFYANGPQPEFDNVEYRRADLAPDAALVAELVEALRAARPHVVNMTQGWPQARFTLEAIDAVLAKLEGKANG